MCIRDSTNTIEIKDRHSGWTDTRGLSAIARFHTCLWGNMHPILGLIRQEHLAKSKPFQGILGADLIVLSELALLGDFVHSPQATWSRRHFRQKESYTQRVKRYKSNEYKLLDNSLINAFPALKLAFELIRVVVRADISFFPKAFTLITLAPTMALKYFTSVNEK